MGTLICRRRCLKRVRIQWPLIFSAPIATAGKAITRFEDKDDGSEYLYTLFVPMDASMAFPCFDQPDLKGKFTLEVSAPPDWTVIANEVALGSSVENSGQQVPVTIFLPRQSPSAHIYSPSLRGHSRR